MTIYLDIRARDVRSDYVRDLQEAGHIAKWLSAMEPAYRYIAGSICRRNK
jgi:hypothetical protein